MKLERSKSAGRERHILISMVTDSVVLGAVAAKWEKDMFASQWANIVGQWCIRYYKKYNKAPRKAITAMFDEWSETQPDESLVENVNRFLRSVSDEYAKNGHSHSSEFVIDQATKYFTSVKVKRLRDDLDEAIEANDTERAEKHLQKFVRIDVAQNYGVDMLDESLIDQALDPRQIKPLVKLPGALGRFIGPSLVRSKFVAFMGREKVGKSFWLQHIAYAAMRQGLKVAFFTCGDMTLAEMMQRYYARMLRRPVEAGKFKYPKSLQPGEPPEIDYDPYYYKQDMAKDQVRGMLKQFRKKIGRNARISEHPTSSISILGIESIIEFWGRNDWIPDVVVIDYADILAGIDSRAESRDQINATWKAMRAMSQKLDNLVVTATQADAGSYERGLLRMTNFSEDKRKYAHVTAMFGINQEDEEKEQQLYRLNTLVFRGRPFTQEKCIWTACCLPLANPCVLSCR